MSKLPNIKIPNVKIPEVKIPDIKMPDINTDKISKGLSKAGNSLGNASDIINATMTIVSAVGLIVKILDSRDS